MEEKYRIELRAYVLTSELGGQGAHLFWAKVAPDGRVLEELHFFGQPGTKLYFKRYKAPEDKDKFLSNRRTMYPGSFFSYSASKARIDQLWEIGAYAGQPLDKLYDYPSVGDFLGNFLTSVFHNENKNTESNAAAYTMGRAMFPDQITPERSWALYTPGWGLDLIEFGLKTGKIKPEDLYGLYGIGANDRDSATSRQFAETRRDPEAKDGKYARNGGDLIHGNVRDEADRMVQPTAYRLAPVDDVTPAMRALNAAKADDTFTKRYMNGDRDAVERMHALHRAAYPEPGDQTVGPAVQPALSDMSAGSFSMGRANRTPAQQALEDAKANPDLINSYLDGDRNAFDQMQSLIRAAFPEPAASGGGSSESGASAPMFRPWTPEAATEGLAPWMQSSLKDYLSSLPEYEGDNFSKLAPWTREQYPAWLRGNGD